MQHGSIQGSSYIAWVPVGYNFTFLSCEIPKKEYKTDNFLYNPNNEAVAALGGSMALRGSRCRRDR